MDHHRQNHHPRHQHQPRQQQPHHHHHQQPRQQPPDHHHHPHPHIMNSPPPPPSSSRYLPLHPPPHQPPPPPPPPPSFPENHPNLFQHPHPQHHPPNLSPPFHPNFSFVNSPPHPHLHHRDDHRDLIFRSPPPRVHPPPPHPQPNRLHPFDDNPNFPDDLVLDRPRFRLNELPPPPPPRPPHQQHQQQHPRVSPVPRRSPNQFVQLDRFGRQFDDPPPPPHPRFREDLNLQPYDSIDYQLHRDRVEDDSRNLGVGDRFEGQFDRDWDRSRALDRGRERDHNERYYPEMPPRNDFELVTGDNEYVNDEAMIRAGRRDRVGGYEENVSKRYGAREVSRSPIKFRIGGVEADDRFSNRGRKEDVHEYNNGDNRGHPRKILQKKSAFLRIQEPGKPQHHFSRNGTSSFRNRFDNTASPHKGKESNSEFVDTTRIGEERVGSPVELDVSFKSNALVAKPIMATRPPTSGVDVKVSNAVSDSGTAVVSESLAKVDTRAKVESVKAKAVAVTKRVVKDSKSGVRVSPIMKRVGKPNNVEVQRVSDSSPGGSSSLSGGITRKAAPKGKVLGKADNKAGIDKVSTPTIKKKRKATSLASRLSNPMSASSKTGSAVVKVASSATYPSDGSMPSDVSEKQLAKELPFRDIVIGLTQNEYENMGKVDNNESPTVIGQEETVGELGSEAPASTVIGQKDSVGELDCEAPAPKRVRKEAILEPLPDLTVSLGAGVSRDHGDTKGYSQDEQRISNSDEDVSKSIGKCSLDLNFVKDTVKDQDVAAVLVDNCSVKGSSELARVHMVDNADNNDVCSGNVDTLDLVAVMNFISNPVETEMDLLCPKVDADEPSETQVLSSPEDAAIGLSLGGLYSDRNDEPGLSDSVNSPKLGRFSNDSNKHSETQAFSSPEIATIGLSLGGLYAGGKFESDLGDSEDNAKLGSFSNDVSVDKRTPLDFDDDVSIGLTNLNTVSDLRVTNDVQEQLYSGPEISGHDGTAVVREEAPKKCIYEADTLPFSVKEDGTVLKRKRKVGIEPDSLDSRMLDSCHESLLSLSIPIENAMVPVEKCSSAASGPPCVETDVSKEINYTESYVNGLNSLNHNGDLDQIEYTSSCGKRRKTLSLSSVFSDASGSESSDPAPSLTLLPVADGPSANNFPQSVEGLELHKSVITAVDVSGGASSSFGATTCSFDDNSKSDFVCKDSCLPVTESAPPDAEQSYLRKPGCNQKIGENMTKAKADDENGLSVLESACRLATYDGNIDSHLVSADHTEDVDQGPLVTNVESDDNGMIANVVNGGLLCSSADHTGDVDQGPLSMNKECDDNEMTTNDGNSGLSVDDTGDEDQRSLVVDMDCDDDIALNANLSSSPGCPHSFVESGFVGVTNHSDMLDASNVVLPGDCSHSSPTLDVSNASPAFHVISGEKLSMDNDISKQSSSTQSLSSSQAGLQPESHKNHSKPGILTSLTVQPFTQKCALLPSKNVETTRTSSNSFTKLRRNVLTRSEATPSTTQCSPVIKSSNKTHTYPAKPRTWHRTNNSAPLNIPVKKPPVRTLPPHRPPYGKAMKVQDTSYIRKGNSLVRNPTSGASISGSPALGASADPSKPNDTSRISKLGGSAIESTELPVGSVTGGQSTPIEMPKTPPLSCSKTPDIDVVCSGECTSSVLVDQSEEVDNEEAINSSELNSLRDSESDGNKNLEDPGIFSDGDLLGSGSKKMVYIKRKSNQLIAASKSSQQSVQNMGRTAASCSDNYYMRRKNQLIRASSDGNIQQMVEVINNNSRSLSQRASHVYTNRSSTKRPSFKGKSLKFSLVWKLGDSKATGKGFDALRSKRLLSLLLPWKRATYWSRKQLSSRKRGAVYVRSGRGFSLRRSKVISLPGTSLKWSKSMEKRSKKVEEEAAQAVAEQNSGSSGVSSKAASSIHSVHKVVHSLKLHQGERIFRIGASRYRMDSSGKTLQRISDEEASEVTASKTGEDARKAYVPKRLLIGSDEYVRIGNGNQLVRDPKRRTRILASEKVRWSLHTARMRLAKKRKFCQFFTRFGKCNKGEGCPFIHDPSKVAVCTKFLNGLCVDLNCKLTHKVIPERMPDCLFYLQGLCSNEKCPYRHVNVNPKASICENFLRGYCAEGDECRKKHSYICPESEACGSCPQGSKCKLYHPKRVKSKKRKVSRDQNNTKGRYFGDRSVVVEPETKPLVEKHIEPSEDTSAVHGDLGDFISLDFDDVEMSENGLTSEQAFLPEDDDPLNSELDDLDELIKPLSIMGKL